MEEDYDTINISSVFDTPQTATPPGLDHTWFDVAGSLHRSPTAQLRRIVHAHSPCFATRGMTSAPEPSPPPTTVSILSRTLSQAGSVGSVGSVGSGDGESESVDDQRSIPSSVTSRVVIDARLERDLIASVTDMISLAAIPQPSLPSLPPPLTSRTPPSLALSPTLPPMNYSLSSTATTSNRTPPGLGALLEARIVTGRQVREVMRRRTSGGGGGDGDGGGGGRSRVRLTSSEEGLGVEKVRQNGRKSDAQEIESGREERKRKKGGRGEGRKTRSNGDVWGWINKETTLKVWSAALIGIAMFTVGFGAGNVWRARGCSCSATA